MKWDVIIEKAIRDDGSLFFPEKLTKEFLLNVRKSQGSYIFANQYMNQIIPEDEKKFRKEWFRYYTTAPEGCFNFGFIDPAISQRKESDWTALVIVSVDEEGHWWVRMASRGKLTPTEIVSLAFNATEKWNLKAIGIENIAYQESLLYMIKDEGKRRGHYLPAVGIGKEDNRSKDTRILGLVPRFEWGRISLREGLFDLETELNFFPRGTKDIIDALARIEQIAYAPQRKRATHEIPDPQSSEYESYIIKQLIKRNGRASDSDEE